MDETDKAIEDAKKEIERVVIQATQKFAILANQTIILATPVDTGRARGNWFIGIDNPVTKANYESFDKIGQGRIQENNQLIQSQAKRFGMDIYLSNNLPYITRLNEGWSAQAPAGFVEKALQVVGNAL